MLKNIVNKSISISLTIIILTGFILGCDAKELITKPETPTTLTKDDLVKALEELRDAMLKKIDIDIDDTAIAFTIVKDYHRTKRLADIFRAPLKVIEGTITFLTSISDLISLSSEVDKQLIEAKTNYQALSIVMMLLNLEEVGGKLYYGLYGPTYISSIENMLDAADETTLPPSDFSKEHYKRVVENYLFGVQGETVLNIPRHSTDNERKITDYVSGALQVRKSISKTFNELIFDIKNSELPEGYPLDEVITELKYLKEKVIKSTLNSTDLVYKTDFSDDVSITLGSLADRKKAWHIATGSLAKKLDIEIKVELLQAGNAILLTTTYIYPNVSEIKIAQKITTLSSITIKPYLNSFHTDPEESFYMLPQEMLLTLPIELSNLWMIADDIDNYLRYLLIKEIGEEIAEETEEIVEKINRFDVEITINSDSSIIVTEKIAYDFGTQNRHGIYRVIPIRYKTERGIYKLDFRVQNVVDETGSKYRYETSRRRDYIGIKIGDPDIYVTGENIYIITYEVSGALNYFDEHDELYWNATGNEWSVNIYNASCKITLPKKVKIDEIKLTCYTGKVGSQEKKCEGEILSENEIYFNSTKMLSPGGGLTIVLGWPKGIVKEIPKVTTEIVKETGRITFVSDRDGNYEI